MRAAGNRMIQDCAALNARLQPAFLDGHTFFANYDHSFVSFVTKLQQNAARRNGDTALMFGVTRIRDR
jgi:hypothetical protein